MSSSDLSQHGKLPSSRSMTKEFSAQPMRSVFQCEIPMTRATPGPKSGSILGSDILRFPFRLLFCAEKSARFITLKHGRVGAFSPGSGFWFCSSQIPDLVSAADELQVGETEKLVKLKKGLEFFIHLHDRLAEFYTGSFQPIKSFAE